jgi:hypothetical protein
MHPNTLEQIDLGVGEDQGVAPYRGRGLSADRKRGPHLLLNHLISAADE